MTCRDEILEAARQLSTGSSNGEFTLKDILNYPGFPFCPPDQNLYPPTRLSARQMSSSHVILLPAPVSLGPRSTWSRLKPLLSGGGLTRSLQQLCKLLRWFHPAERLSRPVVEHVSHSIEMALAMDREVRTSREVLPKQAVGILVRASLPGTVGVAEVDLHAGGDTELPVTGHLLAAVPR